MFKRAAVLFAALVCLGGFSPSFNEVLFNKKSSNGVATLAFQAFATEATGAASVSYAGVNFGTAAANRVLAVFTCARVPGARTVSSMTIGGISASQVSSAAVDIAGSMDGDIWSASVPSGTSGTIAVTWNGTTTRTGVYVYSILTGTPAASNGNNGSLNAAGNVTQTLVVPANGVGIAGFCDQTSGATLGFTNATQDSTNALSGASQSTESGHTTATGSISVTGTTTGTIAKLLSVASWGP